MMEQYNDFSVPNLVDDEFVCSSYDFAMECIKTHAPYIWWKEKDQRAVNDHSIGTWSWYVQRRSTTRKKAHKTQQTFLIHGDFWVDERIRMNEVPWKMFTRKDVGEEIAAEFVDAFGSVE